MQITLQKSNQLKAIAIMMMLCLHLFGQDYHGLFKPLIFLGNQPLSYYISLFCDACVPIFAFVSGYGLYYKYVKNKEIYKKDNDKRLLKLYINYWIIIIIFPVTIGFFLNKVGYPGSFVKFLLNWTAIDPTYNGAWWFFTIYVLFVLTSSLWFKLLDSLNFYAVLGTLLILYGLGFYFRIYKTDIFINPLLIWLQKQSALFFCTLFQFMLGAMALKYDWNGYISNCFSRVKYPNALGLAFMLMAVVFHALVPNFTVAPFTALIFIFAFLQMDIGKLCNRLLDLLSVHATNMWLIHMFFYMIFFSAFIYAFQYPILIFAVLVLCCIGSSLIINFINQKIQRLFL